MKKKTKIIFNLFLLFFLLFLSSDVTKAVGSASTGFSGNSSVYVGDQIDVILYVGSVNGTNGGLAAFGGNISYSTDKLELVRASSLAPFTVELSGNRLGGFGQNTIKSSTNIIKFTFRAKALGSATISYSGSSQPDANATPVSISGSSKTINIVNPPSSNNNLSSLSVSSGGISFNKNTTYYNVSVGANVTSISISASPEDGGASVSGVGSKSLKYGNNKFYIVVTAPSGAKKTYTINVNRKDDRSGNNNLSSLTVNGGELNPNFNKNTTNYKLDVPYSISNLSVNAKAEDQKASVTVSGNNNLIAEETTIVTITVTAENGSKKTYTISVNRGKDPNKILSDNNYLTKIVPNIGILSPVFDKEKSEYEIWLPYEVDKISFDYQVEDAKYATTKLEGNDTLQPGVSNVYKIIVKAESNKERIYKINVRRAKNPSDNSSSNTYIKSIKLKNGKLTSEFNKKNREYYYTKKSGFKITEVIPEDKNSAVNIINNEGTIYIIVTSGSGEYGVYALREKQTNLLIYLLGIGLFLLGVGIGFVIKLMLNNKKVKVKQTSSKTKNEENDDKSKDKEINTKMKVKKIDNKDQKKIKGADSKKVKNNKL